MTRLPNLLFGRNGIAFPKGFFERDEKGRLHPSRKRRKIFRMDRLQGDKGVWFRHRCAPSLSGGHPPNDALSITQSGPKSMPPSGRFSALRSISPRPLPQFEARYSASHMGRLRPPKQKGASPRGETQRMATVRQCAHSASAAGGWPTSVSGATAHGSSHAGSSTATRCARSRLEVPTARVKVPASWRQPGKATSQ